MESKLVSFLIVSSRLSRLRRRKKKFEEKIPVPVFSLSQVGKKVLLKARTMIPEKLQAIPWSPAALTLLTVE